MRKGAGVDHDRCGSPACVVDGFDKSPFVFGLDVLER
jgi:hypothetical protein